MSAAIARLKRSVRSAIGLCGGIDGAAATCERQRSVAGDWNNLNHRAFPPLDCAFAMDEVAVAQGRRPEVVHQYAAELGGVFFLLPGDGGGESAETSALMEAVQEVGDVSGAIRNMLADGIREQHERDKAVAEIDEAIAKLARLRAIVAGPSVRVLAEGQVA